MCEEREETESCSSDQSTWYITMHLDADRDGEVDDDPTDHTRWVWGDDGFGAIITIPYKDAAGTWWREPILFKRIGEYTWYDWTATLEVDGHEKIEIFIDYSVSPKERGWTDKARKLDLTGGTLELHKDSTFAARMHHKNQAYLWVQAKQFPLGLHKHDDEISLEFKFKHNAGDEHQQNAVLRIAPWIMSGDYDPQNTLLVVTGAPGGANVPETVVDFAAKCGVQHKKVGFIASGIKPFLRDATKPGYVADARHCFVACLSPLDADEDGRGNYTAAVDAKVRECEDAIVADTSGLCDVTVSTSQDHGGNLLVSPPQERYPFGRIVYGEGLQPDLDGDSGKECNLGVFFHTQYVQPPIVVDTGWLYVGHVDEIVSFIPDHSSQADSAFPYKILLASPRLAYTLCVLAANHWIGGTYANLDWDLGPPQWRSESKNLDLNLVIKGADEINDELVATMGGRVAGKGPSEVRRLVRTGLWEQDTIKSIHASCALLLNEDEYPPEYVGDWPDTEDDDPPYFMVERDEYESDPAPIAEYITPGERIANRFNGCMVFWDFNVAIASELDKFVFKPPRKPAKSDPVYMATRMENYLRACRYDLAKMVEALQPRLDHVRDTLKRELDLDDSAFIEVPVLFTTPPRAEPLTADSVNLLLASGSKYRHHCLIPKPFGPVCHGRYLFEEYIRHHLEPLDLSLQFANDWNRFHRIGGEIHCGTNQIPKVRDNRYPAWWDIEPDWLL